MFAKSHLSLARSASAEFGDSINADQITKT